jgi:hypothetical protein
MVYQIRIKIHLDRRWTDWFEWLTVTLEKRQHAFDRPGGRSGRAAWLAEESA